MLSNALGKMRRAVSAGGTASVRAERNRVQEEIGTGTSCREGGEGVGGYLDERVR